jgi:Rv0078B-related antitoxin
MTQIPPEVVDHQMAAILREKSPGERLAITHGLWRSTRNLLRCAIRAQQPDWSDEQIQREVARRMSHGAV